MYTKEAQDKQIHVAVILFGRSCVTDFRLRFY